MNENKIIFITGASKGLGKYLCADFLSNGFKIFATARTIPDNAEKSDKIIWHRLDITDYAQCKSAINACIQEFGRIDILVNNASAYIGNKSIADMSLVDINTEIDTTFKGAVYLSQLFVESMRKNLQGKIFFISSTAGLAGEDGSKFCSIYAASKAALIRYSECLNEDIHQYNMRSHVIIPCAIREGDFDSAKAVGFADMSDLILKMSNSRDILSPSQVILRPTVTGKI